MTDAEKREKVIRGLERFIDDFKPFCGNRADWQKVYDALALLKEQEAMPSYNDAVDTIKFQSKVMCFACQTLAGYSSEEPCSKLFYIKEEREKCDKYCHSDGADENCWKRYLSLMAKEDSDAETS